MKVSSVHGERRSLNMPRERQLAASSVQRASVTRLSSKNVARGQKAARTQLGSEATLRKQLAEHLRRRMRQSVSGKAAPPHMPHLQNVSHNLIVNKVRDASEASKRFSEQGSSSGMLRRCGVFQNAKRDLTNLVRCQTNTRDQQRAPEVARTASSVDV